ncbi:hypothetical protein ERJ75_001146100 [Trypanosoma vivax]|nr:hypothetical protein ERJ75_001146100 [Trypanosoma vivax]
MWCGLRQVKFQNYQKAGPLSLSSTLLASGNISSANANAKRFKDVASLLVQNASRVEKSTANVEGQLKKIEETLKPIKQQLVARLNETQLNISNLAAGERNKKLLEVSRGSWGVVFDRALGINVSALLETNKTLKELEAQIVLMKSNLTEINNRL